MSIWTTLVRRVFFLESALWFPIGIIHEDNAYVFRLFLKAKRAAYLPEIFYQRRIRAGSTMTTPRSFRNVFGVFYASLDMEEALREATGMDEACYFEQELHLTVTLTRESYAQLPPEEQQAYHALPDGDRRRFRELVVDAEDLRASVRSFRSRLKKADREKAKLQSDLKKARADRDKKLRELRSSWSFRVGQAVVWLPEKLETLSEKLRRPASDRET